MNKRLLITLGVLAVAIVVGFIALRGPSVPNGTEGAITPAQRYDSQQIDASDVSLDDPEIQAFVQSDLFHKMATNEEFRSMALSNEYRLAAHELANYQLSNEHRLAMAELAANDGVRALAASHTLDKTTELSFAELAAQYPNELAAVISNELFQQFVSQLQKNELAKNELANMELAKELWANELAKSEWSELANMEELQQVMKLDAIYTLANSDKLWASANELASVAKLESYQLWAKDGYALFSNDAIGGMLASHELAAVAEMLSRDELAIAYDLNMMELAQSDRLADAFELASQERMD